MAVTLLSDFGTRDGYVASMKGVILSLAPDTQLVDVGHEVPSGDVEFGAWVLGQYWDLYPSGVVHLVVIDPGVGGARKAMAVEADGRYVVTPDNGVITRVLESADHWRAVELKAERYRRSHVSATFHGRDLFAPAAAHLALGLELGQLGPELQQPVTLRFPAPTRDANRIEGRVAHVDRFGNLVTDIPGAWIPEGWIVRVDGREIGALRESYSDVMPGSPVALVGSLKTLEVAVRDGSAAAALDVQRDARVEVREPED